jgi:hypothetical protein
MASFKLSTMSVAITPHFLPTEAAGRLALCAHIMLVLLTLDEEELQCIVTQ